MYRFRRFADVPPQHVAAPECPAGGKVWTTSTDVCTEPVKNEKTAAAAALNGRTLVRCVYLIGAVLWASAAWGEAPAYSAESIVNGANFAPGPLAPNSAATIFGTNLAWWTEQMNAENTREGFLPGFLADVRVFVANYLAPLIYVSPTQINFLVPGDLRPGPVTVWVARQGVHGPEVTVTLVEAAPQFFASPDGYVIAQHTDYSQVTPEHPALPGEVIVVYATGLGITRPNPAAGEIPKYAGLMARLDALRVSVGGVTLEPERVLYAGLTPGWAGLYQINLRLPDTLGPNPELRAEVGEQSSMEGLKLAAQPQ